MEFCEGALGEDAEEFRSEVIRAGEGMTGVIVLNGSYRCRHEAGRPQRPRHLAELEDTLGADFGAEVICRADTADVIAQLGEALDTDGYQVSENDTADFDSRDIPTIGIGCGSASGSVLAGYTGTQRRATDPCIGDTVHGAARLESYTQTVGQPILMTACTCQARGESLEAVDRGLAPIKGETTDVPTFAIPVEQGR